ncbi:RNA methyltransferase [Bengtsoniella intestinalis]|uniref:TrmH family RNA methyltransferase n=1 Tax=Bengtsoniella intestinalis TaxID=3073143 RepID=UPI00391EEA91
METITSRQNALCSLIRKLATSSQTRKKEGLFLCDSPKLMQEALAHGIEVNTLVCTQGMTMPQVGASVRQVEVPAEVMQSISPMQSPQGLLGVCALPDATLPQTLTGNHYVVLDTVQDPGNVGTILRTADAFGADGLLLTGNCADLYNPKTLRASMGAAFRCKVWNCAYAQLETLLQESALPMYGAALRDDTIDARQADYTRCAIAIGSEGKGLSAQMLTLCEKTLKIPMQPHCESLNAASAATVLLWEMFR